MSGVAGRKARDQSFPGPASTPQPCSAASLKLGDQALLRIAIGLEHAATISVNEQAGRLRIGRLANGLSVK
jgi:hypothetical protein